jgi:flagellar P-ring protein precursor FlgI
MKKIKFRCFTAVLLLLLTAGPVSGARLKDLSAIKGVRSNQLVGYGLVVGLDGTGDKSGAEFTIQALANMMERMGVHVNKAQLNVKNVAAVMITANIPPFARIGSKIDLTVSSVGDAKSLSGGTLLLTPLKGVDGKVYALGQGPVALGGTSAGGTTINHVLVGRIAGGATVEREIPMALNDRKQLTISLFNPDFTTVQRVEKAINDAMGEGTARAVDSGALELTVPENMIGRVPLFIAGLENVEVEPDTTAKVVVNEKTGTVIIGKDVSISSVAVAHGNLTVTITESPEVSQPEPLSEGETVVTPNTEAEIFEEDVKIAVMPAGTTIGDLVKALNALGVGPRDLISIFQSIKAAGALQAELEII